MCIALLSTAHPAYRLILIDNRDEFLNRPTAHATWWPEPHSDVLGGRDLLRPVQGTWLGITKSGKIAVLTNYREDAPPPEGAVSRGAIMRNFLTEDVGPMADFVKNVVNTGMARDAGGFSLVCGQVGEKLAVISNRAEDQTEVPWIAGETVQTVGLSNAAFTDRSWKKVTVGEALLLQTIQASIGNNDDQDHFVASLFEILSTDTLPRTSDLTVGGLETYLTELRNSIFVPPLGRESMVSLNDDQMRAARKAEVVQVFGAKPSYNPQQLGVDGVYATQKQTIVLVDNEFNVRFVERTLFDSNSEPVPIGKGDVDFKFKIEK